MVYALHNDMTRELTMMTIQKKINHSAWPYVNVEDILALIGKAHIVKNNMRFLQDPSLYPKLTVLVQALEGGSVPTVRVSR